MNAGDPVAVDLVPEPGQVGQAVPEDEAVEFSVQQEVKPGMTERARSRIVPAFAMRLTCRQLQVVAYLFRCRCGS